MLLVGLVPLVRWQARELVGDERLEERGAVEVGLDVADDLGGGDGWGLVDCCAWAMRMEGVSGGFLSGRGWLEGRREEERERERGGISFVVCGRERAGRG